MSESIGGGKDLLQQLKDGEITYAQYEAALKARKEALENKPKPLRVDERVDLEKADREERQRQRQHPTSGSARSIPDRWTSTGSRPERPGE